MGCFQSRCGFFYIDFKIILKNVADVVDGNQKSIMRLILALAARYKPSSVKQSGQSALKYSVIVDMIKY